MKIKQISEKGRVSLVLPENGDSVVARLEHWEGTECWSLTDIRLAPHSIPSAFSFVGAEQYHSTYTPNSIDESEFVKSKLRDYFIDDAGTYHWCTFAGIVKGEESIGGYSPSKNKFAQGGYFSYKTGIAEINKIREFWSAFEGNIKEAKIANSLLQLSESEIRGEYSLHLIIERQNIQRQERINALPDLRSAAGVKFTLYENYLRALSTSDNKIENIDWQEIEICTIRESIGSHGQSPDDVKTVLFSHSPGAMSFRERKSIESYIDRYTPDLLAAFSKKQSSALDREHE